MGSGTPQQLFVMNSEWKFLIDTVVRWMPYVAVLVLVPLLFLLARLLFRGSCRNGPIERLHSLQDEELRVGSKQYDSLDRHRSLPETTENEESFRVVDLTASPIKKDFRGVCGMCQRTYCDVNTAHTLPCQHHFHGKCAEDWFNRRGYCPQCIRPSSASVIQF